MGRISLNDLDNYATGGSGSFFQLKNDGDRAKVRFLYNSIDELQPYVVHEVQVGDKSRYVNCLRNYDEPIDKCPLCAANYKAFPKLFLKLYNEDAGECQVWERGRTFASRISNLASHFNPLVNEIVEITRFGEKGDMQTKYEMLPLENSPVNLDDYEAVEPLGFNVLDKSEAELNAFLDTGSFPDDGQGVSAQRSNDIQRRTPSNNSGRRAF